MYIQKYIKYKSKYLLLKKSFVGGAKLKYYNVGDHIYNFKVHKLFDITESTSIIFIKNDMLITTRLGKIILVNNYTTEFDIEELMDLSNIEKDFSADTTEEGLLGLALVDDKLYLSFTVKKSDKLKLLIKEFYYKNKKIVSLNKLILKVSFPTNYHHGGHLEYYNKKLYLGIGDGGPQGDPYNEAQNLNSLRGKILEIDLETREIRIKARGLRNPWKFSFDPRGNMWIGDVGWNAVESIKIISDLNRIYNFGWNYYEGSKPVDIERIKKDQVKFEDFDHPSWEYPLSDNLGRCVIGGYYMKDLGLYIFADYIGIIRALKYKPNNELEEVGNTRVLKDDLIYSLGFNGKNIYVLTNKKIYILEIIKN